jgi:hypothetical protein
VKAPSRFEVDHLHRLMTQASAEAARLEKLVSEEQRSDGLSGALRGWQEAADDLHSAIGRAGAGLLGDGTPKEQLDRILERLNGIKSRSRAFDLDADLDACVEDWQALGLELAQLSGKHRDALVTLLQSRRLRVDQTTATLSAARQTGGMLPEKHRKVLELQGRHDQAREKYERLREQYLEAEKQLKEASSEKPAAAHAGPVALPKLELPKGPAVVRLPEHAEGKKVAAPRKLELPKAELKKAEPKKHEAPKLETKKLEPKKKLAEEHEEKPARHAEPATPAGPPRIAVAEQPRVVVAGQPRVVVAGQPRVVMERLERIAGFTTGRDGIGRGSQTAALFFRAEDLPHALQVQGSTSINLGCSVRLDVLPSVQLFSSTPGAPARGKISLTLISSGGYLGKAKPADALDAAREAARAAGPQVAARLGIFGDHLEGPVGDALEDAAAKIFSRAQAQAVPGKLPVKPAGPPAKKPPPEQHLHQLNDTLGPLIAQAREVKVGRQHEQQLSHLHERDHHPASARLEKTLSHLAATHRTLNDARAGEMRNHLARMDAILAKLRDNKVSHELEQGAHELGSILHKLGTSAQHQAGAPHIATFKKLIDERKGQLQKVAKAVKKDTALGRQSHSTGSLVKDLHALRKLNPGLDKLLKEASHTQLVAELGHALRRKPELGAHGLTGLHQSLGGAHLGGFGGGQHRGGLSALAGSALGKALEKKVDRAKPGEVARLINHFNQLSKTSPLHEVAKKAEEKQKRLATHHGHGKHAHVPPGALHEVFKEHKDPKAKAFAGKFARGGELHQLVQDSQRGHGLPIGAAAQHYLASRGHSRILGAVSTFNTLTKAGHKPRFSLWGDITGAVSSAASSVAKAVENTASNVGALAQTVATTVGSGISDLGNAAGKAASSVGRVVARAAGGVASNVSRGVKFLVGDLPGRVGKVVGTIRKGVEKKLDRVVQGVGGLARRGLEGVSGAIGGAASRLWNAARDTAGQAWGGLQRAGANIGSFAQQSLQSGAAWAQRKAGAVMHAVENFGAGAVDWAKHKAAMLGDKVQSGLEWAKKTGIAGGLKGLASKGLHALGDFAKSTPLGRAVSKGYGFVKSGGLNKLWSGAKGLAGKAWGGVTKAYKATSGFLQSPGGQLLVTGLSLAASFVPGGMLVKGLVGGAVGAIQAVSEGKSWKGVLASAAGGALTGALPFLKIGPLAKMGLGALQGGIATLAGGGSLKDALKGAAGGVIDSFDPGAFGALKRLKGFTSAEKLLTGKNLSKAEKEYMAASKFSGPLRGLEKAMENPRSRKLVGGLEKAGNKAVKGGIWLSGKAGQVQGVLEKVMGAGDKIHGVLSEVQELAPNLADALGDNPAGRFVRGAGEWAGEGDDKLEKALAYGHKADDTIGKYKGYLDKGLGYAGVKDPKKAFEKMQARNDPGQGKKGPLSKIGKLKLEDRKAEAPELELEKAGRKRAPKSALEKALAKGVGLAQNVHDKLGKVHDVVEKGLGGAEKVQHGLEKATGLARQGAELLGEDSELGKHLGQLADRADSVNSYLEKGIGVVEKVNDKIGAAEGGLEKIRGVHKEGEEKKKKQPKSPLSEATHLEGKKAKPHEVPAPASAHESPQQKSERLQQAWTALGNVSRRVQAFESEYAKTSSKLDELLSKGKGNEAAIELMGLGAQCDAIRSTIAEAKRLSKGNGSYEKECKFYEEWHKTTAAKLHAAIAHTKGLGQGVQISGFGFDEKSHPDIFENTQEIFAIDAKVKAFGAALSDHEAAKHVKELLADAKAAKAQLQSLKSKYKKDTKAYAFLTGGGEQDRLIDRSIAAIEKGLGSKSSPEKPKTRPEEKHKGAKGAEHGLKAIEALKKKALKTGRKIDGRLGKIEKALNTGIRAGKKVDAGLEKIAGVAGQVTSALGADTPMGHLADQVEHAAKGGHEKLHSALNVAQKGKSFLHTGHELFDSALKLAAGHHGKAVEKVHGKKPPEAEHSHGGASDAELLKHTAAAHKHAKSPHGLMGDLGALAHGAEHLFKDGKRTVHDASKLVHDGQHGWSDAQHAWKDGKKLVHGAEHAYGDAKHAYKDVKHGAQDVKSVWAALQKGDFKGALAGGKSVLGDAKTIFGEGKELFQDGKELSGEGKALYKDGKGLIKDGKEIASAGKHVVGDISHLIHAGKEWVHGNLHNLDLSNVKGQAEKAMHILPEWLKGVFGGKGGPQKADPSQAVQEALALVQKFAGAVASAVEKVETAMHAGDNKTAESCIQGVTQVSEQARAAVTEAVKAAAGNAALAKQAAQASTHYLAIRKQFFGFVQGLHGLAKKVPDDKYPDLSALQAGLGALQVKVDSLGDLKNADSQMQPMIAALQKELAGSRAQLTKAKSQNRGDEAAGQMLGQLENQLNQLEKKLSAHSGKANAAAGDQELGQQPAPKKKQPKKHQPAAPGLDGDDGRVHVDRGGNRGDVQAQDGQDVDPAALDTWIGSGEGLESFSQVFGGFLPAEGAGELVQAVHGAAHANAGGHANAGSHSNGRAPGRGGVHQNHGSSGVTEYLHHGSLSNDLAGDATRFLHPAFDVLRQVSDGVASLAERGSSLLGQGMHYAEEGEHLLSQVEGAAHQVQGLADEAEGFLGRMGLGRVAGLAHRVGSAAGFVDHEAQVLHGGLATADQVMGQGRAIAGEVSQDAHQASGVFGAIEHGNFGPLVSLFRSSKDGFEGKLAPDKARLGSVLDEPRRLDGTTLSKMSNFLGGDFNGVRIHTGLGAAEVTSRFRAEAVTVKDHIFFAPGRFSPDTLEGQKLLAHELTHVLQMGRPNLDVRTAEGEALNAEHSYGSAPDMTTLNLSPAQPDFKLADGQGVANSNGVYTAKRTRSRGGDAGGKDKMPDGDEFLESVSSRVYDLLMEEMEQAFESR